MERFTNFKLKVKNEVKSSLKMYVGLEYSVFSLLRPTKGSCKNLALPKITRFLGFLDGKFQEKSKKSNTKSSIVKMKNFW